jgi:hypothetical protein
MEPANAWMEPANARVKSPNAAGMHDARAATHRGANGEIRHAERQANQDNNNTVQDPVHKELLARLNAHFAPHVNWRAAGSNTLIFIKLLGAAELLWSVKCKRFAAAPVQYPVWLLRHEFQECAERATPPSDLALLTAGAEWRWRSGWSVLGKFDGEFANGAQTYTGTGKLEYTW